MVLVCCKEDSLTSVLVPLPRRASRSSNSSEPAVFLCISMLARAVGPQIETEVKSLLDQMFSAGLSAELTSALKVLAMEIPKLQRDIQGQCRVERALFAQLTLRQIRWYSGCLGRHCSTTNPFKFTIFKFLSSLPAIHRWSFKDVVHDPPASADASPWCSPYLCYPHLHAFLRLSPRG